MNAVSERSVRERTWTRIFVDCPEDRAQAEAQLAERLAAAGASAAEYRVPLRLVTAEAAGARVSEVEVLLLPDGILTLEPGSGIPLLQDVEARLLWAEDADRGAHGAGLAIVRAGFQANADSLARIEADIRRVRASVAVLEGDSAASRGISVSDLPEVSELLVDIDAVLSHVATSVGRLSQLARLLRREAAEAGTIPRPELDALIQQGEALSGRVEFLVDRHRFHSRDTSQRISTSDLNIVKIFTVLWAILIPGTTLINWYGQNFEFMPELSWEYSSWVQIVGVFFLAVLPIYTVKRAGQLR